MNENNVPANHATRGEILLTRVFDAPKDLVFNAWADPEHLTRWYAPHGCTIRFIRFDFRPGGSFVHLLKNPAVRDCLCGGVFREIVVPERIVYTLYFSDEAGNFVDPVQAGMQPDWPKETVVTVTFTEQEGRTKLTLRQTVQESLARRTGAYQGWVSMLDRLATELALNRTAEEAAKV